jgi:hypothetical protein
MGLKSFVEGKYKVKGELIETISTILFYFNRLPITLDALSFKDDVLVSPVDVLLVLPPVLLLPL